MDTLEQLKTALEEKRALLKDLDERILALLEDEAEIVAEIEGAEGVKDKLRAAFFKVNKVFGPVATPPTASATATGGESSTSTVKLL